MVENLIRFGLLFLLGRLLVVRLVGCLVWVLVIVVAVAVVLLALPISRAHASSAYDYVLAEPLVAPFGGATSGVPRVVHYETRVVVLPETLPAGAKILLAGDASGEAPIACDDTCVLEVVGEAENRIIWSHDFRSADGITIEPHSPVDLTDLLPRGQVRIRITIRDLRPPRFGATSLVLVVVAPAAEHVSDDPDAEPAVLSASPPLERSPSAPPAAPAPPAPIPATPVPPAATPVSHEVTPLPTSSPSLEYLPDDPVPVESSRPWFDEFLDLLGSSTPAVLGAAVLAVLGRLLRDSIDALIWRVIGHR